MSVLSALAQVIHGATQQAGQDAYLALGKILGHPAATDQSARPTVSFSSNESNQNAHTPAQVRAAAMAAEPQGYEPWRGVSANTPDPIHQAIDSAQVARLNSILQNTPAAPNANGATPPQMVNVSWSPTPVPYSQSLNGPPPVGR